MFYDHEILNRRGGRFGLIWLAATRKLTWKGPGGRRDINLALKVDIGRTCEDILRYVRVKYSGTSPADLKCSFSLYLSSYLVHGTILIFMRQLKHARGLFVFQSQPRSVNLPEKDKDYLLPDVPTLADGEYGKLADVIETLSIAGVGLNQGAPEIVLGRSTPDRIEKDVMELEVAFNDAINNPDGHFALESDITLRELDQHVRTRELEMIDESFPLNQQGNDSFLDWPAERLPDSLVPMDVDTINEVNLKRQHDMSEEVSASKKLRESSDASNVNVGMEIELAPLENIENQLQTRKRRRRNRLIVDQQTQISSDSFKAQQEDFSDTMRVSEATDDKVPCPRYADCTVKDLFIRPAISVCNPLRELIHRQMTTRQQEETIPVMVVPEIATPQARMDLPRSPDTSANRLNMDSILDSLPQIPATAQAEELLTENQAVFASAGESSRPLLPDDSGVETLRHVSRDVSVTGSIATLNNSKMDVSANEKTRTSVGGLPERHTGLETLKEVSIEVSQQSNRLTKSTRGPFTHPTLHENIEFVSEQNLTTVSNAPVDASVSVAGIPGFEPCSPSTFAETQLPPDEHYENVRVPGAANLLSQITSAIEDVTQTITFRELVPPTRYSRVEAAKIFLRLLRLGKRKEITLHQEPTLTLPYEDIHIQIRI